MLSKLNTQHCTSILKNIYTQAWKGMFTFKEFKQQHLIWIVLGKDNEDKDFSVQTCQNERLCVPYLFL